MTPIQSLQFLARARQAELDAESFSVYLTALRSQPEPLLARACFQLADEPRVPFTAAMPVVGDILAACRALEQQDDETARKRLEQAIPVANEDDPSTWVRCRTCEDVGWIIHRCEGGDRRLCGRPSKGQYRDGLYVGSCHAPHTYAIRCSHV